jgi:transposase-like protein
MAENKMPECIECHSNEVVEHKHDVAAFGDPTRGYAVSYECVECGRQWQPSTDLTGYQSSRPISKYS